MTSFSFRDPQDLAQLAARGISPAEAERQLAVLARPAAWVALERPCTVGDGIERLDAPRRVELHAVHARAAAAGRVTAFVPASGAATRMFKELIAALEMAGELLPDDVRARDDAAARALVAFVQDLPRFAFADALARVLASRGVLLEHVRAHGPWRALLDAFLDPEGLDAARAPKGLLYFHRVANRAVTAFEEHLVEACTLTSDAAGTRVLDVTVSAEHRVGFERLLAERLPELAAEFGGRWQVQFGEQHPSTDTLAGDPAGGPFRDDAGRLLFRPAGHGALLANLAAAQGEFVFLKNIDNVAVARLRGETEQWSRALVGLAVELSERLHGWCARLAEGDTTARAGARAFAAAELGGAMPEDLEPAAAARWLDRPVRVCGMVANTGEPGGGPFWAHGPAGVTRQIVESSQVDPESAAQQAVFRRATHFNPVFLAVALRDAAGRPHGLARFVDDTAVIVTRRSHGARALLALERPGLWNGAMAEWHTRFVEVPLTVFNPVKTVFDLLRPEHQDD